MTTKRTQKIVRRAIGSGGPYSQRSLKLRFIDDEHLQLVREAAAFAKLTMNAWLTDVTVKAARAQLKSNRQAR
jgi:hypothetical protein